MVNVSFFLFFYFREIFILKGEVERVQWMS